MSSFTFGQHSETELVGVNVELVGVVRTALKICEVDFSVHDGIRTHDEQQALVTAGASKTMDSRHLTGHAVDLVPYINGKMRWEWAPIFLVALAMQRATIACRTRIRWGCVWDKELQTLMSDVELEVDYYKARRRRLGKRIFLDGPHFELPRDAFPA